MDYKSRPLAFFKAEAAKTLPLRPGPIQCVRNCNKCVRLQTNAQLQEPEEIINIKSYDNLLSRTFSMIKEYKSIQYHPGQIDVLKAALTSETSKKRLLYLIAANHDTDLKYLQMVLKECNLQDSPIQSLVSLSSRKIDNINIAPCYFFITIESIIKKDHLRREHFSSNLLRAFKEYFPNEPIAVTPVILTKDHNRQDVKNLGSICIQILEPYEVANYLYSDTRHFVQHLFFDMISNIGILPTHLTAFVLLYPCNSNWCDLQDLCEMVDWLRQTSSDTGIKLCFTGSTVDVVYFGLHVLKDHVRHKGAKFIPQNVEALDNYARLIYPLIAYQAITTRAIFDESHPEPSQIRAFQLEERVKVRKDRVVERANKSALCIEQDLNIKPPCSNSSALILETIDKMHSFGHYFKISEPSRPKNGPSWMCDSDDDEDYWIRNRNNPSFQTWLILSSRHYRRKRLNMLLSFTDIYLPLTMTL